MMLGPIIPLILFGVPVVVAVGVVVVGVVGGLVDARREVARLPRAVARPVKAITQPVKAIAQPVAAWIDDEVTRVFDRSRARTVAVRAR